MATSPKLGCGGGGCTDPASQPANHPAKAPAPAPAPTPAPDNLTII